MCREETCGDCRFWADTQDDQDTYDDRHDCRVNAPQFHPLADRLIDDEEVNGEEVTGYWPRTADDEWCGKWRSRGRK